MQSEIANVLAHSNDNLVVSAPTGAGKTAVFEMAMARLFGTELHEQAIGRNNQLSKRRKIVYIAPSKALCEERFEDWSSRLSQMKLGIEVALITGDGEHSDSFRDAVAAHVILTTPEKWDSLTRRWTEIFFLFASVKLFLIDEVHLLGDDSRGCCLESIVCRMKTIQRAATAIRVTGEEIQKSR
jgi:ATP-dependent DNA helicase HFM1/MER3